MSEKRPPITVTLPQTHALLDLFATTDTQGVPLSPTAFAFMSAVLGSDNIDRLGDHHDNLYPVACRYVAEYFAAVADTLQRHYRRESE